MARHRRITRTGDGNVSAAGWATAGSVGSCWATTSAETADGDLFVAECSCCCSCRTVSWTEDELDGTGSEGEQQGANVPVMLCRLHKTGSGPAGVATACRWGSHQYLPARPHLVAVGSARGIEA